MADTAPGPGPAAFPWTQTACMVVGGLLIVFGVFGFAVTGFGEILERDTDATLFGLELNPLQNLTNVIFAAACVYLAAGVATGSAIAFGPVRAEDVQPRQRQRRAPAS